MPPKILKSGQILDKSGIVFVFLKDKNCYLMKKWINFAPTL